MVNSKRTLLALLLTLMLYPLSGNAANPLVTLPEGDFVCVVDVQRRNALKNESTEAGVRLRAVQKKITITTSGNIRRDVIQWSDGKSSELWWMRDKGVALWENNQAENKVLLLRGDLIKPVCPKLLFLTGDSMAWIQEKNRSDKKEEKALHYEATVVLEPAAGDMPASTARFQAWIDPETLRPLKFDDGDALYVLKFMPYPAGGPLVMPPRIKSEWDLWLVASTPKKHR